MARLSLRESTPIPARPRLTDQIHQQTDHGRFPAPFGPMKERLTPLDSQVQVERVAIPVVLRQAGARSGTLPRRIRRVRPDSRCIPTVLPVIAAGANGRQ
jgi:hypothetical protein